MSAQHTPGPWFTFANATCVGGPAGILGNPSGADTAGVAHCGMALRTGDEVQANARLIAAAPAMALALQMLELGVARIERSASGQLVEFCFNGIRYCHNGDWSALLGVIGWDKARAAVAERIGA